MTLGCECSEPNCCMCDLMPKRDLCEKKRCCQCAERQISQRFRETCPCAEVDTAQEAFLQRERTKEYKRAFDRGSLHNINGYPEPSEFVSRFQSTYMRDYQHPDIQALYHGYETEAAGEINLDYTMFDDHLSRCCSCPPWGCTDRKGCGDCGGIPCGVGCGTGTCGAGCNGGSGCGTGTQCGTSCTGGCGTGGCGTGGGGACCGTGGGGGGACCGTGGGGAYYGGGGSGCCSPAPYGGCDPCSRPASSCAPCGSPCAPSCPPSNCGSPCPPQNCQTTCSPCPASSVCHPINPCDGCCGPCNRPGCCPEPCPTPVAVATSCTPCETPLKTTVFTNQSGGCCCAGPCECEYSIIFDQAFIEDDIPNSKPSLSIVSLTDPPNTFCRRLGAPKRPPRKSRQQQEEEREAMDQADRMRRSRSCCMPQCEPCPVRCSAACGREGYGYNTTCQQPRYTNMVAPNPCKVPAPLQVTCAPATMLCTPAPPPCPIQCPPQPHKPACCAPPYAPPPPPPCPRQVCPPCPPACPPPCPQDPCCGTMGGLNSVMSRLSGMERSLSALNSCC